MIAIIAATIGFAVVPFGPVGPGSPRLLGHPVEFQIAPGVDVGIVYVFAIGSLAVYGVILAAGRRTTSTRSSAASARAPS